MAIIDIIPDRVLWLDLDPAEAASRRAIARGEDNRIEARGRSYLRKVYDGFAAMTASGEIQRIDASGTADETAQRMGAALRRARSRELSWDCDPLGGVGPAADG